MTSLVAHGLDQIQRGTWWNEPTEPWRSNIGQRAKNARAKEETVATVRAQGRPVSIAWIAEHYGISAFAARNKVRPVVQDGRLARLVIDGAVHVAAPEFKDRSPA
jgi:hypothetical protein